MTEILKNEVVDRPLISVVLPVYNGKLHLEEAIESILAQSFTNFELILIDDGSTDTSQKILREFELRDRRVRVITQENKGLATTLNEAIKNSYGMFVARMDQDDIALPNRLERQLEWLEKTGADICGSWVRFFGAGGRRVWKCYQTDQAIKIDMLFRSPLAHPAVLMRADVAKNFCYRPEFDKAEDYDLWVRFAQAGLKMTNIPEVLLLYRIHPSQTSALSSVTQRQLTAKIQREYWKSTMNQLNIAFDGKEVINLVTLLTEPDMDIVDKTLGMLLEKSSGEELRVIMDNISWLYLRISATNPNVISRWRYLHKQSGLGRDLATIVKFYLIYILRARRGGFLFNVMKRAYYFFK